MNLVTLNQVVPAAAMPRRLRLAIQGGRPLAAAAAPLRLAIGTAAASLALAGHALAQAAGTASTAGIGAQVANMAQEGSNLAGNTGSFAMYGGAIICFVAGVWFLWESRRPQNREGGKVLGSE